MVRDDRRDAGRRRFCGDHAERLRKDRRHDRHVAERQQVDEVAVLECAREERSLGRHRLELAPVIAEADDHSSSVDAVQRLEQDVNALVLDQLADVDDAGIVVGEERHEASEVALVGKPVVAVTGVRRVVPHLREERPERLRPRPGREVVDVDAGRHLVDAVDLADDLFQHAADVLGADIDGACVA